MLRTEKVPFLESMAGRPVLVATGLAVLADTVIPFTRLGAGLGLTALPVFYFPWLPATLGGYLALAQRVKRRFVRRFGELI
jgi:Mg2+-importing ATPase